MNYTNGLPKGAVIMWHGSADEIPDGWAICNGENDTPDLRSRFVVGAGEKYSLDETGGQDTVTLSKHEMPLHTHTTFQSSGWGYSGEGRDENHAYLNYPLMPTVETLPTGGNGPHENRPPFYALFFIKRII